MRTAYDKGKMPPTVPSGRKALGLLTQSAPQLYSGALVPGGPL